LNSYIGQLQTEVTCPTLTWRITPDGVYTVTFTGSMWFVPK
jgi:hypothetical protein